MSFRNRPVGGLGVETTSHGAAAPAKDARQSTVGGPDAIDLCRTGVKSSGPRAVMRWKENGQWRESTWNDWDKAAREVAAGLIGLGLALEDRVAILGNTRPEWLHCDLGILLA